MDPQLAQHLSALRQLAEQAQGMAGKALRELEKRDAEVSRVRTYAEKLERDLDSVSKALTEMKASRIGGGNGNPDIALIESIPGKRLPFDLFTVIAIGPDITNAVQQGSILVSQDGPFVAVGRFASLRSSYEYQAPNDQGSDSSFLGRSNGRFRPVSSSNDLLDALAGSFNPTSGIAFPGTGAAIYASPSNHSPFRTMEFDGLITFRDSGASYPRSNQPVPSSFWTQGINGLFQLAALDFFERGSALEFDVTPTHTNNPAVGNLSGYGPGVFPFIDSQYDHHEGINDPSDPNVTTDPVTRVENAFLHIGFHGIRIVQTRGPIQF